jgi:acetamidase/formamidase
VNVRQIRAASYSYVFSPYGEPVARVRSGEVVDVFTEDAFESKVQSEADLPTRVLDFPYLNPQTGPIAVEGAAKGDTLAVEILEIEPTRDFVVSAFIPDFGGLTGTTQTALLNEPLPERVFVYPLRDGAVELRHGRRVPYEPFVGTIATAPEIEAIGALAPGPFGGNMDVPDTCPGNVVRLPVSVDGAFFYTGDAHAAQGDGELCGVACEMTARVRVRLTVENGRTIRWPRIESPTELMVVGSARPMEDAARIAWKELVLWLEEDHGIDRWEAYQLLTHAGRMRVGNMVDPLYSVVARLDKRFL